MFKQMLLIVNLLFLKMAYGAFFLYSFWKVSFYKTRSVSLMSASSVLPPEIPQGILPGSLDYPSKCGAESHGEWPSGLGYHRLWQEHQLAASPFPVCSALTHTLTLTTPPLQGTPCVGPEGHYVRRRDSGDYVQRSFML